MYVEVTFLASRSARLRSLTNYDRIGWTYIYMYIHLIVDEGGEICKCECECICMSEPGLGVGYEHRSHTDI